MKLKLIGLITIFAITVSGCKNGANSIPELSAKIINALQKHSKKLLESCVPTLPGMEKACRLYLPHAATADEKRLNQDALDRYASLQFNLSQAFANVETEGKLKNLDWEHTRIKDLNYTVNNHPENYKDAAIRIILITGKELNVILYKAYLLGNRWYLMEGPRWEE